MSFLSNYIAKLLGKFRLVFAIMIAKKRKNAHNKERLLTIKSRPAELRQGGATVYQFVSDCIMR